MKVVVVTLCCLLAGTATAEPTPADAKAARQHFAAGRRLIEKQKFEEGIREIESAYELDPQALHLYNLGVAHHLRGDDILAIEYYRLFMLDAAPSKETRSATGYLTQLEKKLADVRSEKSRKDIAEVQAKATQAGATNSTELLLYSQSIADAESNERRVALIDDEIKAADAEIAETKKAAATARSDAARATTLARRWERHARMAPAGEGRGRRVFGALLLAAGTAAITFGAHDLLSREENVDIADSGDILMGAGTGALLIGLTFFVWGESAASAPRPESSFGSMQVVPTIGRDTGGLSFSGRF